MVVRKVHLSCFLYTTLSSSSRRQQQKSQGQVFQPEEKYEDEEQLATVTIVEDFDPDTIIHGPPRIHSPPDANQDDDVEMPKQPRSSKSRAVPPLSPPATITKQTKAGTKANLSTNRTKTKLKMSKKVKYQTKAERSVEMKKQRARRTEKAERAGGKASRKNSSLRGRPGGKKR